MSILGLYFIFFRIWYRKKRISREVYFITDKRIVAIDTMRDNVTFDIPINDAALYLGNKSLILGETNSIGDFVYIDSTYRHKNKLELAKPRSQIRGFFFVEKHINLIYNY